MDECFDFLEVKEQNRLTAGKFEDNKSMNLQKPLLKLC